MKTASTLITLLLLLAVPTMAQENSKLHFLVNGGLSMPDTPGEFSQGWKDGTNFGGGVGYHISPRLSVLGLVSHDRFAVDSQGLLAAVDTDPLPPFVDIAITGADMTVLSLSAELKASLVSDRERVSPYVTIGGGVAEVEVSDITISTSFLGITFEETMKGMSETSPMATVGAGVDVPINERLGGFVEGRYQSNFTEGGSTDFGTLRAGIRINR